MSDQRIETWRAVLLFLATLACIGWQAPQPVAPATQEIPAATPEGQTSGEQASGQEATPQQQPIPEGDIPAQADIVTAALRRIETLVEPDAQLTRIAEDLDSRATEIQTLRGELDAVDPAQISERRLGDLRLPWLELARELDSWRAAADERFDALQEEREFLRDERTRWDSTLQPSEDAPPLEEPVGRAQALLDRIVEVEAAVIERRDAVASVIDRIATNRGAVSGSLDRIDAIGTELASRQLSRDAPPLWRSLGSFQAQAFAVDAVAASRAWAGGVIDFLRLHHGYVVSLVGWFLVVLLGARHLGRRSRAAGDDGGEGTGPSLDDLLSDRARRVLERPVSVALICAVVITLVILPNPTGSAADITLLLVLVPALRLGAVVFEDSMRRALYGIVVLIALLRLTALGPDGAAGTRLLLLFVTGVALALVAPRARFARGATATRPRGWDRVVEWVALAATLTLGAALLANVLGWVQFSRLLTAATIGSLFGGLGWAALVIAITALLPAVIREGPGRVLSSLRRHEEKVTRAVATAVTVVAVLGWLDGVLAGFRLREPVAEALARIAGSEFPIGGLTLATGGLLGAASILVATWLLARLAGFFLAEEVVPRLHLRRGSGQSLQTLTNYVVWGVGIALACAAAGLSGTQLAVVIGALSVGIGFGLQTIVNNFVSGLILIFERPIKVGDTLQTPDYWGRVQHIGIRASVIRSFDGAEIIVPNGDLISKEVTNWTRSDDIRRVEVLVGVAYGTDPERVLEILQRVAGEHEDVLRYPQTDAQMIAFGDSSLDFRLRCWTLFDHWLAVLSDLNVAINRELAAADITIPFPQRDLHIKSPGPGVQEQLEGAREPGIRSAEQ